MSVISSDKLKRHLPQNESRGFTMMEIIAILVILGILAKVAVGRLDGIWISVYGDADRLASDLRYAQSLAMTRFSEEPVRLTISGGKWSLNQDLRFADGAEERDVRSGVSVDNAIVEFEYPSGTPSGDDSIILTRGNKNVEIKIHPETGYVEIQ